LQQTRKSTLKQDEPKSEIRASEGGRWPGAVSPYYQGVRQGERAPREGGWSIGKDDPIPQTPEERLAGWDKNLTDISTHERD
jgi:hypothetical protein